MINKNIKLEQIVDQLLFSMANFVSLIIFKPVLWFFPQFLFKIYLSKKKNQYRPLTFEEGKKTKLMWLFKKMGVIENVF